MIPVYYYYPYYNFSKLKKMAYWCPISSKKIPLLRRPDPLPSLDEYWKPPPCFNQHSPKKRFWSAKMDGNTMEPGLNAKWHFDLCLFKRAGISLPVPLAYATAWVRHSKLIIGDGFLPPGLQIRVPLVDISFIELDGCSRRKSGGECTGRMLIRGRGLFSMLMFLTAQTADDMLAIRDWLRFLVVRQRIPHLILALHFGWAKEKRNFDRKSQDCPLWERFMRHFRSIRNKIRLLL